MESNSDNTISTNQNKVLKMAMQMNQANLDVWLDRQSTDLMREEEVSETVALTKNDGIGIGARGDTSVSDGAGERGVGASTAAKSSRGSH